MSVLIRTDEAGVMKRPNRGDGCVRRRAAELALPQVKQWLSDPRSPDSEILEQLAAVLPERDGYEIANELRRRYCWNPDARLVEILDARFIQDAERELVKQWVACVGVKQQHAIGTVVICHGKVGEIGKWDAEYAQYGVHTPDQPLTSHYIIDAEKVELALAEEACA